MKIGIALDVGALSPLPRAAEPGQAITDVEDERVALLLAVVADVDAGFDLLRDDVLHRGAACAVQALSHRPARRAHAAHRGASAPSGRGRLPVCVVRIRFSLRRIPPPNAADRVPAFRASIGQAVCEHKANRDLRPTSAH